jgi:galactokinase
LERLIREITDVFRQRYGGEAPVVVQAPGRVNLIGEHTDYNDGFVFPIAIDRTALICGRKSDSDRIHMYSMMYDEAVEHPVRGFERDGRHGWANYILGVVKELQDLGHDVPGADIVNSCSIPLGSGLSSSAALEVAVSTFFEEVAGLDISPTEAARLCQRAENNFVGVNCGIMDQFISRLGKKGTALLIDCRSLEYEHVPFDNPGVRVLICNTGVKRGLVDSEYNTRRAECEEGVRFFSETLDRQVTALRDVTIEEFRQHQKHLPETVRRRCRHVITENERVLQATGLLKTGDYEGFGKLLYASHESLRDDYEVSCRELDLMVEILRKQEGVLGARMTGAGFGGCTVSICHIENEGRQRAIMDNVAREYADATGITSDVFFSSAESGASRVV